VGGQDRSEQGLALTCGSAGVRAGGIDRLAELENGGIAAAVPAPAPAPAYQPQPATAAPAARGFGRKGL